MEQLHQGFRDSTPRAGSDILKKSAKKFAKCITINIHESKQHPKVWDRSFRPFLNCKKISFIRSLRNHLLSFIIIFSFFILLLSNQSFFYLIITCRESLQLQLYLVVPTKIEVAPVEGRVAAENVAATSKERRQLKKDNDSWHFP